MSSDVKIPEWAMEEGLRLANDSELSLVTYESSGSEIEEATKSDAEVIARALLAAEQRGLEKAGQSLAKAEQALKDWLHVYAPDLCDPEEVLAAQGRIGTQGTIAYIADALAAIRSLGEKP